MCIYFTEILSQVLRKMEMLNDVSQLEVISQGAEEGAVFPRSHLGGWHSQ